MAAVRPAGPPSVFSSSSPIWFWLGFIIAGLLIAWVFASPLLYPPAGSYWVNAGACLLLTGVVLGWGLFVRARRELVLVRDRRDGTRRLYGVDTQGLTALRAYLESTWHAALAAFAEDPPAKARLMPLSVAGAFHTVHMAPAVDRLASLAGRLTDLSTRILGKRREVTAVVVEELWPDFSESQLDAALAWYTRQDRTRGG